MNYYLLTCENDAFIAEILSVYRTPSVARYISIDESNYWNYVTGTENVWFYKIFENDRLVAAVHLELSDSVLYMDIVVFPEYQNRGIALTVLKDIQSGKLGIEFEKIQVAIDETNTASIKMFERAGFVCTAKNGELLEYEYIRE